MKSHVYRSLYLQRPARCLVGMQTLRPMTMTTMRDFLGGGGVLGGRVVGVKGRMLCLCS